MTVHGPNKLELPALVHRKHNDVTNLPSKTELRLLAKFLPSVQKGHWKNNNYSFASGAAVGELTDAFGLKLQQREAKFSTSYLESFFVQPDAFSAYNATKPIDLVALARGEQKQAPCTWPGQPQCSLEPCRGVSLRAEQVHYRQLEDILMLAFVNCSNQTSERAIFTRNAQEFGPAPSTDEVQHWNFGELGPSWVLSQSSKVKPEWQNNCTVEYDRDTCVLYRAASFTVTSLDTSGTLVVLVASTVDAAPIVGAHLSLYQLRNEEQYCSDCRKCACNEVRKIAELTTTLDGVGTFAASNFEYSEYNNYKYVVVAQHAGEMELAPPVSVGRVEQLNTKRVVIIGDTIVDRALFDAGDTIHVTGILRAYDWRGNSIPLPTFTPTWSKKAGHAVCQTPWGKECVTADKFGIVSCAATVPANATHGSYTVQVLTEAPSSNSDCQPYSGQASITVADPRRPSATLDVSTDSLLINPENPDTRVKLNISCQTYLGDKVKGASVQIHWEGTGTYSDRIQPQGEYPLVLPTGKTTDHVLQIPRHVVDHLKLGTSLTITVSWLDATRDLLQKKLSVPIELSTWTIFVETNPPDNRIFAGFPFRATGTVRVPAAVHFDPEDPPKIEMELIKLDANGHPCTDAPAIALPTILNTTDSWMLRDYPYDYPCGDHTPGECSCRQDDSNEWVFSRSLQLTLPDVNHYRLEARVVDSLGQRLNASLDFGRNETQQALGVLMGWKQTFWKLYLSDADADRGFVVGDTATVHWFNPLSTVHVLLTWGNDGLKPRVRQHKLVPHGAVSFSIPIGEECTGGCNVQAFVIVPSQLDAKLPIEQPKSQLFDLALPEADLLPSLRLNVGLDVPITVGVANLTIIAPEHATAGENVSIEFEVVGDQGQPADVGEIAVYVVDEALLDLLPYEIPPLDCGKPYEPFDNYVPDVTVASSIAQLGSESNVNQALKSTEWRLDADPWTSTGNWGVRSCLGPLDIVDQLWMDSQVTPITYGFGYQDRDQLQATLGAGCGGTPPPVPPGPPPAPGPAPAPPGPPPSPAPHNGGHGGGAHNHRHPAVRQTSASTAFYRPDVSVKDGKATVSFQMPQNLGTWRVSAVAVSKSTQSQKSLEYVKGQTRFVSRLPVSLQPSMPRVSRVGERFSGGCVIDSLTPGKVKVTVSHATGSSRGSLKIISPASQIVDVEPNEPLEVLWKFAVLAIGQASLEFDAVPVDKSVKGDAFTYSLPLDSIQQQVTLSTSFALLANRSFTRWTEGFDFPPAVQQSGTLSVAAGVGHFPAQRVIQTGIDSFALASLRLPVRQWPDVFSLIAALAPPSVLNAYGQANTTSNIALRLALLALRTEYNSNDGLQQIPTRFLVYPSYSRIPANAFALRVRRESILEFNSSVAYSAFETASAVQAAEQWEQAIVSALVRWRQDPGGYNSDDYSWHPTPSWWDELALAFFGLGKEYHLQTQYNLKTNSSLEDLKAHARMCDVERQAMIALVLLEKNVTTSDTTLVTDLTAQWYDHLRVQGETAYISEQDSSSALGLGTQALCLHVFALTKPTDPLVEKLANYVSAGPAISSSDLNRLYSFSHQDATYATFALAAYDRATGSASPRLSVFVAEGDGSALFNASFQAGGSPAVHEEFTYSQIDNTDRLQFYALGTGEASVAVAANFVPAQLEVRPVYFGLFVQKSVSIVNADGTKTPVNLANRNRPLRPGQIIQVTISVTSPDDQMEGVQVYDPLPGAFQAQDPLLKSSDSDGARSSALLAMGHRGEGLNHTAALASRSAWDGNTGYDPYSWFPNSPWRWGFAQMDVFPDHVSCSTPSFSSGTSECIYTAEVVTSGEEFVLPPSHAWVPTRPGTMGLSGTVSFSVAPRSGATTTAVGSNADGATQP